MRRPETRPRNIDPANPPGPKRKPVPHAGERLRDFLIDTGPPAILPTACKDPEACRREIEARQAWWLPTAECLEIELLVDAPPNSVYRLVVRTNQTLTKGDVETIVVKGIPAMHRARGERAPCDCIAAQEGDGDGDEPAVDDRLRFR